jgi:2-oxoglutarate dehydrogenase E2 component (dihydrolipoamide succinyltransferase)
MATEIKAPTLPESVPDGTIATWYKKPGQQIKRDELLVDIETDKVLLEVVAPTDGVLASILKPEGATIVSNEVLAVIEEGASAASVAAAASPEKAAALAPAEVDNSAVEVLMSPAARKLIEENKLDPNSVPSTGKDGRITKEDVVNFISAGKSPAVPAASPAASAVPAVAAPVVSGSRPEQRVPMTRLRAKVAERLLQATQSTAMLTTFNEVNMAEVMALRSRYKDLFEKKHSGVRLGFMSFFVRASIEALKRFPAVNASIDGNDIIYHGYQDIGVAVSSPRGLVVPVLRDADTLSFAEIEKAIGDYGVKARDGKLSIEEMTGGTFTISNGGVFGSLLSTPILNPPQTAILGMHKIQERPMAVNGEVKILPMMYLALSYDHRMIDGKEAVQFLVTIKELLEDPARIFLEV